MPNWCEGTLRIRGKFENIKEFLLNGIQRVDGYEKLEEPPFISPKPSEIECEENDHYFEITFKWNGYIKGARRMLINGQSDVWMDKGDDEYVIHLDVQQAWSLDVDELREISENYGIDLAIYGFERGREFNQDILIINGKIIRDEVIEYDDYQFECPCPKLGG